MTPLHTYCKPLTTGASNAAIIQALKVSNPALARCGGSCPRAPRSLRTSEGSFRHAEALCFFAGHEDVHADAGAGGGYAVVAPARRASLNMPNGALHSAMGIPHVP